MYTPAWLHLKKGMHVHGLCNRINKIKACFTHGLLIKSTSTFKYKFYFRTIYKGYGHSHCRVRKLMKDISNSLVGHSLKKIASPPHRHCYSLCDTAPSSHCYSLCDSGISDLAKRKYNIPEVVRDLGINMYVHVSFLEHKMIGVVTLFY